MPKSESPVIALCWGTLIGNPLETLMAAAARQQLGAITLTSPMYEASRRGGRTVDGLRRAPGGRRASRCMRSIR